VPPPLPVPVSVTVFERLLVFMLRHRLSKRGQMKLNRFTSKPAVASVATGALGGKAITESALAPKRQRIQMLVTQWVLPHSVSSIVPGMHVRVHCKARVMSAVIKHFPRGAQSALQTVTPNPSIEGMPKRLRLLCTPHVKR
jgi:hypothetical protein